MLVREMVARPRSLRAYDRLKDKWVAAAILALVETPGNRR
jgi:hypothetical protein